MPRVARGPSRGERRYRDDDVEESKTSYTGGGGGGGGGGGASNPKNLLPGVLPPADELQHGRRRRHELPPN
ncbi:hypothetical protein INR49_018382 [Caranx melampygus]|nr:hypothetical protein INR49_018382 [Caranx melampygus]